MHTRGTSGANFAFRLERGKYTPKKSALFFIWNSNLRFVVDAARNFDRGDYRTRLNRLVSSLVSEAQLGELLQPEAADDEAGVLLDLTRCVRGVRAHASACVPVCGLGWG